MRDIMQEIKSVRDEIEIRIQDYVRQDESNDINAAHDVHIRTEDFLAVYYPEKKPFQRVIGKVKR